MSSDRLLPAIGLRLVSVGLFATMNAAIKLAEQRGALLPEIMFYRQFGASILVTAIIAAGPGLATVRTQRPLAHLTRMAVGVVSMGFTFGAIMLLPLAEATTIAFSTPIFATILGALVLGEPTGRRRWSAVALGFVGVVIVVQPGGHAIPLAGALCGLAAALLTAVVFVLVRQIGRHEPAMTIVWWFSVSSLVPLGLVYLPQAVAHPPVVWLLLAMVGIAGGLAQLTMTGSLKLGPVSVVVPFDYTSLLWATAFGWVFFGTLPGEATWIGAPIIVASGLYIVWREHVRRRAETQRAISEE